MPDFIAQHGRPTTRKINQKQTFLLCIFRLPDSLCDRLPHELTCKINADLLMGFYVPPHPGDRVFHAECEWEIIRFTHRPARYKAKGQRYVSEVELSYVDSELESLQI